MRFQVKNSNIFPVPGNTHMLHLGTIEYGFQEFIVMLGCSNPSKWADCVNKVYIEEVVLTSQDLKDDVTGHCKFIEDDNLAHDLAKYAEEQGLTDVRKRLDELGDRSKISWITKPDLKK